MSGLEEGYDQENRRSHAPPLPLVIFLESALNRTQAPESRNPARSPKASIGGRLGCEALFQALEAPSREDLGGTHLHGTSVLEILERGLSRCRY